MNNLIMNPEFAYFMGVFAADGSFYLDESGTRFELCDGTSVENELFFSKNFIISIKTVLERKLNKEIKEPKRKGNQFILKFRCIKLSNILRNDFKIFPGPKTRTIDIPEIYRDNPLYESSFWLGVMDGDGMIARGSRKISLWSASFKLIESFKKFLSKKNVMFSEKERTIKGKKYFGVEIKSPFIKKYSDALGFRHPRKKLWLEKHLENNFYLNYDVDFKDFLLENGKLDVENILNSKNIFIVNGKEMLKNYGIKRKGRSNVPFIEFMKLMKTKLGINQIYKILINCRWKMSKGSTVSIRLPLEVDNRFIEYARFVRLTDGGIRLSRNYIKAFNRDVGEIVKYFTEIFNIEPKITSKGEILFCSGVLSCLFSNVLVKKDGKNKKS